METNGDLETWSGVLEWRFEDLEWILGVECDFIYLAVSLAHVHIVLEVAISCSKNDQ